MAALEFEFFKNSVMSLEINKMKSNGWWKLFRVCWNFMENGDIRQRAPNQLQIDKSIDLMYNEIYSTFYSEWMN